MSKGISRRSFVSMVGVLAASAATGAALTGCGESKPDVGFDIENWDAVLEAAKGSTVTYSGYGQATAVNDYFNNVFAPEMKEKYDIRFNYQQVEATADIFTAVSDEKQAGKKLGEGTIDTAWVSGVYFDDAKDNELLYGEYLKYLPNMKYYNEESSSIKYDCGAEINGMESLFATSYFAVIYDQARVKEKDVPRNAKELLEYAKKNPGRVTYTALPDYQGCYWARNLVMDICGADCFAKFEKGVTYDQLKDGIADGLEYLRELNPYLWNKGKSYPSSFSDWTTMFANGEVDFIYDQAWVKPYIDAGTYPKTTHSVVCDNVISLPHYLTIPFDCPNLAAALVMCNEFLDPVGMCERATTGYPPAVDAMKTDSLDDTQKKAISDCEKEYGTNAPSLSELAANAVADMPAWVESIWHDVWQGEVAKK